MAIDTILDPNYDVVITEDTEDPILKDLTKNYGNAREIALQLLPYLGLTEKDLELFSELTIYSILDGHRSGVPSDYPLKYGYMEGAVFAIRWAKILQVLGANKQVFMVHTERNRKTSERMGAILGGIKEIAGYFIGTALEAGIRLHYSGRGVHDSYELAPIIQTAEGVTEHGTFNLHFMLNYSEEWALNNQEEISKLPDITTVIRFTKGHLGGVWIPTKANYASFIYCQNASVSNNWTDAQIIFLSLLALKSYIINNGTIGSRTYNKNERSGIYEQREISLVQGWIPVHIGTGLPKRSILFFSEGPITYEF